MFKGIPKILHQTCRDKNSLPQEWREWQSAWIGMHPTWEYKCWDDRENQSFVEHEFPQYLKIYSDLPKPINRVDLCKFLYLYKYGGFYVDMDCKPLKPLDALCDGKPIIVGEKVFWGTSYIECALLGSRPAELFWLLVVELISHHFYHPNFGERCGSLLPALKVIMTTGPIMMRQILQATPPDIKDRIQILPEHYFFPDPTLEIPTESFCVHYCHTSWLSGHEKVIAGVQRSSFGHACLLALVTAAVLLLLILAYLVLLGMFRAANLAHRALSPLVLAVAGQLKN